MKIRVTSDNYRKEVLQSAIPVLVEFFATWCGKCAMMADVLTDLAKEHEGIFRVWQIDIDQSADLASEFEVEVVPTFVVFKNGRPVAAAGGVLTKEALAKMI